MIGGINLKVSIVNISLSRVSKYDKALAMYLKHEIEKDSFIEVDSIREMVEIFKAENFSKGKYRGCHPEKLKVLTGEDDNITNIYLLKETNAHHGYYELMKIQFIPNDDAAENNLTTNFKPHCQSWKVA